MSEICKLEPQSVWKFFDLICSIPHPSGHENALAEKLCAVAREAGLTARRDESGNVRIDRPAAPGFEQLPTVILQGHLDMVPASDHEFDFLTEPVTPRIDGQWVTACGTTLGADNGIGVAHALAILCDKDLKCGALAGLFTVNEETGLLGAAALPPEFLAGKYLLNCDNGDRRSFSIGCAGGARQIITFTPSWTMAKGHGVKLTLSGLKGGHSGTCIHLERGNAIKSLAEFLDLYPEISLASITSGTVDNAIPAEAAAYGASELPPAELQQFADAFVMAVKADSPNAAGLCLTVTAADTPEKVWTADFRARITAALALTPDGAFEMSENFDAVRDSSNLAIVRCSENQVEIRTSQRSLVDAERDRVCGMIASHFATFGGTAAIGNVYPASTPKPQSHLLDLAVAVRKRMNVPVELQVIHAGLESGWFALKNPDLEIISCGPYMELCHTPQERLEISSVAEFDRFIRLLLADIAGEQ